ncbi:hypothetical protein [Streptomyces sp. NBC_01803]|uniref:hypothetical protein n=1 Tax=Streptomyces sp. NBC_01803 TaxID=2975946 RepID=UPI002DDA89B4|nr:hypothetical protein [Streptomyces sp. NBC_01803]WSA47099.1 hypothetical protein OIE51_24730 [Streptomyces sp. NBC_01803]
MSTQEQLRVVALGAICDIGEPSLDRGSQNFIVSEFALLEDGRRLILHAERGFTVGWGGGSGDEPILATASVESITHNVLNVVLPDDDDYPGDHPWEWLAELSQARGIAVSADDLRELPYEVVLSDRLRDALPTV